MIYFACELKVQGSLGGIADKAHEYFADQSAISKLDRTLELSPLYTSTSTITPISQNSVDVVGPKITRHYPACRSPVEKRNQTATEVPWYNGQDLQTLRDYCFASDRP